VAECNTHRRYAFLKMRRAAVDESPTEMAWDGIRRGEPGTTLPVTVPARAELVAAGYLVLEEVEGADETELTNAGLSPQQAAAVLAAVESLT
jgi:hypothetical protein